MFYDTHKCPETDSKTFLADSLYKPRFNKLLPHSPNLLSLKGGSSVEQAFMAQFLFWTVAHKSGPPSPFHLSLPLFLHPSLFRSFHSSGGGSLLFQGLSPLCTTNTSRYDFCLVVKQLRACSRRCLIFGSTTARRRKLGKPNDVGSLRNSPSPHQIGNTEALQQLCGFLNATQVISLEKRRVCFQMCSNMQPFRKEFF